MKKFVKIVSIILALAMVLALAGCTQPSGDEDEPDADKDGQVEPGNNDAPSVGEDDGEGDETPDVDVPPIHMPGNDNEQPDVEVPDASELVDKLAEIVDGKLGEMNTETYSLDSAARFGSWFGGMEYTEGTKIAVNSPIIGSIAHVVMLIQPADGVDTEEYKKAIKEVQKKTNQGDVTMANESTVSISIQIGKRYTFRGTDRVWHTTGDGVILDDSGFPASPEILSLMYAHPEHIKEFPSGALTRAEAELCKNLGVDQITRDCDNNYVDLWISWPTLVSKTDNSKWGLGAKHMARLRATYFPSVEEGASIDVNNAKII